MVLLVLLLRPLVKKESEVEVEKEMKKMNEEMSESHLEDRWYFRQTLGLFLFHERVQEKIQHSHQDHLWKKEKKKTSKKRKKHSC